MFPTVTAPTYEATGGFGGGSSWPSSARRSSGVMALLRSGIGSAQLAQLAAGGDRPEADDAAAAVHGNLVVHVRAAAGVVRDDRDDVADLGTLGALAEVDEAVLLVERVETRLGVLDDQAVTAAARRVLDPVVGERLRAAVEDAALGRRSADDRGTHAQGAVLERNAAVRDARAVAVDVRARPHLGDLRHLV